MKNLITNLSKILNRKEKNSFLIVLIGTFIVGLMETISISSLVGYLIVISDPDTLISKIDLEKSKKHSFIFPTGPRQGATIVRTATIATLITLSERDEFPGGPLRVDFPSPPNRCSKRIFSIHYKGRAKQ